MKNTLAILQIIALGFLYQVKDLDTSDLNPAKNSNKITTNAGFSVTGVSLTAEPDKDDSDDNVKKFIQEMYDARLMDFEEGKLAAEKANQFKVKVYGQWMVREQKKISTDLRSLAESKNISLPDSINEKKANGLADLKEQTGKKFDKKFIKMMKVDHRRDIRKLKAAKRKIKDAEVHNFISRYQPMIESHLDYLKTLD